MVSIQKKEDKNSSQFEKSIIKLEFNLESKNHASLMSDLDSVPNVNQLLTPQGPHVNM